MARILYLYSGFTPNMLKGPHVVVPNFQRLLIYMQPYLQQTVTLDNYRINGGVASVAPPDRTRMTEWLTNSYAIEYDSGTNTGRAFFIRSAQPLADYIDYELELDNWGTFYHQATLNNLVIKRTNRNIGTGIYDRIELTGTKTINYLETTPLTTHDVTLVFSASETIKTGVITQEAVSHQRLLGINMATPALDTPFTNLTGLAEFVGGIFEHEVSSSNPTVRVTKAWLIPTDIAPMTTRSYAVKFKSWAGVDTTDDVYEVKASRVKKTFTISTDPNYRYYFGTSLSGLELSNLTTSQTATIEFIFGSGDIKVMAYVGDKAQDITEAFSISITTNDSEASELDLIAQSLTTIGSGAAIAASVAGALAPGVGVLAGLSMLGSVGSNIEQISQVSNGRYIPGGDGWTTWFEETGDYNQLSSPYRMSKFQSLNNESEHVRTFGAVFGDVWTSLEDLFDDDNYPLLGTGSMTDTYVEADCQVTGIQLNAAIDIQDQLKNGVYLVDGT